MGGLRRRVLKFGGTSVGTAEVLRKALDVAERAARERPVVVVVSALSGVTNALEAPSTARRPPARRPGVRGLGAGGATSPCSAPSPPASPPSSGGRGARTGRRARGAPARGGRGADLLAEVPGRGPRPRRAALGPIVAAALRSRGLEAYPVDAASLLRTDGAFGEAAVDAAPLGDSRGRRSAPLASVLCPWSPDSSARRRAARRRSSAGAGRT